MKFKIYLNKETIYKGTITCVGWSSNNEVYSCGFVTFLTLYFFNSEMIFSVMIVKF